MKYLKHPHSYISGSILMALISCLGNGRAIARPATQIDNQAAGVYVDAVLNNTTINTSSNIVSITVQEVAGLTITANGITRADGGVVNTATVNDLLFYNFDIQNTGNDTTKFFVPNLAQVSSLGSFQKAQYFDGEWQDVPATGYISSPIAINGKLQVRVVVKITSGNGLLTVTLGQAATTNQARINDPEDIYTVDNNDGTLGEINGLPANGVREAQAAQALNIGLVPEALTVAKLSVNQPFNSTDGTIGFGLTLQVLDTVPPNISNVTPTDLTGQKISINGQDQVGILLTDAIPLQTQFVSATTPSNDWVPVYYYSSSPIASADRPDNIAWSTSPPDATTAANVQRVGFFRQNYRIPKGTTIQGFGLKVKVTDLAQLQIYNIAQVLGSNPANPNSANDTTPGSRHIYDESGDGSPSNYNIDGTRALLDTSQQPAIDPGIIDPASPDNDPRSPIFVGEDSGTTSALSLRAGRYLRVPISTTSDLKNGPQEQPTAVGQTNDNDDFTNKSTAAAHPTTATFTNTVINTSQLPKNIKIVPQVNQINDLPHGTTITLQDLDHNSATASFTYQNGIFTPTTGSPVALIFNQLAANSSHNYTVTIDLPSNSPLVQAFPVQLVAFIDANNNSKPDNGESQNITIDRIYRGVMQVVKEFRILDAAGRPIGDGAYSASSAAPPVESNQLLEYRITYTNISTPAPADSGSQTLSAINFTVIEDGRTSPNTWASLTTNEPNAATGTGLTSTITYETATGAGGAADPAVVKYTNRIINPIVPGGTGTFTFRRQFR
jgi:hypothetical protein